MGGGASKEEVAYEVEKKTRALQLKLDELAKALEKHQELSPKEIREIGQKELGLDLTKKNFAIAGRMKTGKSSLINALRCLHANDNGAAKVGNTETTQVITAYKMPGRDDVILHDIPGGGSITHGSKNYYNEKRLCGFDCLMIIVEQSISAEDIGFGYEAIKCGQPVVFVRSKCDQDIRALALDEKITARVEEDDDGNEKIIIDQDVIDYEIQKMANFFAEQIGNGVKKNNYPSELKNVPIFFVSSRAMLAYRKKRPCNMKFQEKDLIDFVLMTVKYSKNVIG